MSGGSSLHPTFTGHVATTQDALILFEACLQGHLSHVPRRPHDRERNSLIRSGCVFIYEENASGIKRWTDGITWSPSRILGNFLVYRELDKPFPPGEKKKANKTNKNRRPSRPGDPYSRSEGSMDQYSPTTPQSASYSSDRSASELERQLIGSLVDSYGFKTEGLVKKTMSVTVQGVTHHLVSYYNVNDVVNNSLRTPSQTDSLQYIRPRPELTNKQSFRSPLEEPEELEGIRDGQYQYRMTPQGYVAENKYQYYVSQPFPPMASHQQAPGSYPVGGPAITQPYIHMPVQTQQIQPQRSGEYGGYEQTQYNRGYAPLQNGIHTPTQSKPPPSVMPPIVTDRSHQSLPSANYSQSNMAPRPPTHLSPVSTDSRGAAPYGQHIYNMSEHSPVDGHRPSQQSPVNMKFEARREAPSNHAQMYHSHRPPYYHDSSAPAARQEQYQSASHMAQWHPSAGQ